MTKRKNKTRKFLPMILGLSATATAAGGAVYFIHSLMTSAPPPKQQVIQQVRLIRPPPPPEVEKPPPPPPEVKDEVKLPDPEPTPETPSDEPPPGERLALDADGVAGGDSFGLGSNKGGRSLVGSGGDRFGWYAGVIKEDLVSFLTDHRDIRSRAYDVRVRLWLKQDGAIERATLASSTGDRDLDRELERLLGTFPRVAEAPPTDMPQPVQLRIVSRL